MEDLEGAPGSPALQDNEEPQGNNDPRDPLNPGVEEEDRPNAPMGDPTADVDAFEDEEAPETVEAMDDAADEDEAESPPAEDDSELEELDETQFQDFDPSALNIPDKPVAIDETNVALLGVHKRKRTEEEERERKKKRKEGRREKPKRIRKKAGSDGDEDDFEGGEEIEGKRARKGKVGADGRSVKRRAAPVEEDDESLTPEERRRRALERKMDEALKAGSRSSRRRGRGIDLEAAADAEIADLAKRMADACQADADARSKGQVATHKLAILPEVTELMNRNTIVSQLEDPESAILTSVRFMLEPADHDAALPNYKIQRELFKILAKLNLSKDALRSSQIGKVVLFYTKSTQPQPEIKRVAQKLIGEWMRVVLGKHSKDLRRQEIETKSFDPLLSQQQAASQGQLQSRGAAASVALAERRKKALEQPIPGNRARVEGGVGTYTIAPVSNLSNVGGVGRKMGASGEDAFRKIAARGAVKAGGPGASSGRKG